MSANIASRTLKLTPAHLLLLFDTERKAAWPTLCGIILMATGNALRRRNRSGMHPPEVSPSGAVSLALHTNVEAGTPRLAPGGGAI